MKPKVSGFIATSLDGFVAREDGGLDWLDSANASVPSGEECGCGPFLKQGGERNLHSVECTEGDPKLSLGVETCPTKASCEATAA